MFSRFNRSLGQAMLASASVIAIAAAAAPASAREQRAFDIPEQPLSSALMAYSHQADTLVVGRMELLDGKRAPAVQGLMDEATALTRLLEGSGLRATPGASGLILERIAQGPQGGSAGGDVDALIVTAQKREENIQDVPIAISAFSQEDLTRSQIAGGPDLITQVPNMTFTKTNFSSYSVQLRGIGTQAISATTDPAVAVAFNNTPFIRNRFFEQEFYDLQRVEVLRGPQGTLYGRNATAGVVNIISAKPKFVYEAKASADVSNFNSTRFEGMVNVPLVEDAVALRLAGAWTKRDGYATNEITGAQIDGRDLWSTRVSLRVTPNDRIEANLIWEHFQEDDDRLRSGKQLCKKDVVTNVGGIEVTDYYQRLKGGGQESIDAGVQATFSQGCQRASLYSPEVFQTPTGLMLPYYAPLGSIGLPFALLDPYVSETQTPDLRVIESTIDPDYRANSDLGELQISFDLTDRLTLLSETAYSTDQVYSMQDFNRFNTAPGAWSTTNPNGMESVAQGILSPDGFFCDPQLGCSNRLIAVDVSTAESWQFSQELRLSSDFEGPFNFSLGANYLRADSEDKYYVFINSLSLIAARSGYEFGDTTSRTYVGGVSDNSHCLGNGSVPGDPNGVYSVTNCVYIDPNPIGSVNDEGHNYFLSKNPYKLVSYAAFGEAYYNITDNLKITGGLRLTVDKKDAPRIPTWILGSNSVGYPVAEIIDQEWSEPTGRLTIDWKPDLGFTDETLVYGSYAHGYKAGGANPPGFVRVFYADPLGAADSTAVSATRPKTFDAEFIDAFEIGSKNTLADGTVTLNLAAFYYDYKDYQISEIVDRSAFNRNFDATVWGLEVEADWRPLENLKFGFKGGYEKTRIADGERAIDLMDRTAGDPSWTLERPFPTYASSCIMPTELFVGTYQGDDALIALGGFGGGGPTGCEIAYLQHLDPVTQAPYVDLTTHVGPIEQGLFSSLSFHPGYAGWDPSTAPNNGEGIFKDLSGNELPNAPQFTATVTADYTVPLPNAWLATLHTDLHWQSELWWRIFNDHEFNRLDEYFTMNLAAIFTNEEAGWNVMVYVKNVTDETAITGAFLNSDDTGLTTNVFLTEPRLYGIRVTKAWTGAPLLGSFGERHDRPYPFTVELGGQVQRHDAPNALAMPSFAGVFGAPLDIFDDVQERALDWGDGRDLKLTWRPADGPWSASAAVRYGKTNGYARSKAQFETDPVCGFGGYYQTYCTMGPGDPNYDPLLVLFTSMTTMNWSDAAVTDREEFQIVDLVVGRDVGLGGLGRSTVSAGLRQVRLESTTQARFLGVPDWTIPQDGLLLPYPGMPATHTQYEAAFEAERMFEGFGPVISWDTSFPVFDGGEAGRVDLNWSLTGGALFGDQEASVHAKEKADRFETSGLSLAGVSTQLPTPIPLASPPPLDLRRSRSVTVPVVGVSLGLSYTVDRFSLGAGYRWERYFDAIDGGVSGSQQYDRTIDGPYLKLSVGFGG